MSMQPSTGAPLDPARDPDRWERTVAAILRAARPELSRLAAARTPLALITWWRRPVLAAAATVVLVASAALLLAPARDTAPSQPILAEALVPSSVASWLVGGAYPTAEQVVYETQEAP